MFYKNAIFDGLVDELIIISSLRKKIWPFSVFLMYWCWTHIYFKIKTLYITKKIECSTKIFRVKNYKGKMLNLALPVIIDGIQYLFLSILYNIKIVIFFTLVSCPFWKNPQKVNPITLFGSLIFASLRLFFNVKIFISVFLETLDLVTVRRLFSIGKAFQKCRILRLFSDYQSVPCSINTWYIIKSLKILILFISCSNHVQ